MVQFGPHGYCIQTVLDSTRQYCVQCPSGSQLILKSCSPYLATNGTQCEKKQSLIVSSILVLIYSKQTVLQHLFCATVMQN